MPKETLKINRQWIIAQRIGFISHWLNTAPDISSQKEARKFLKQEIAIGIGNEEQFIYKLPPSIFYLFLNIQGDRLDLELRNFRSNFSKTIEQLRNNYNEKLSPPILNGAQIISHHILHGSGQAKQLIRFAKQILSHSLTIRNVNQVEEYIACLRSKSTKTEDKLESIAGLRRFFNNQDNWPHVENSLYQQIFCWPLLIFKDSERDSFTGGISLPIGIDVNFDKRNDIDYEGGTTVNIDNWKYHLKKATDAAKILWEGKHGNAGEFFKEEIKNASISFDFRITDEIVSQFPVRVFLTEGSADAYFSQIILSRFLGKNTSFASAVSGTIGDRCKDEDGTKLMDFHFIPPSGARDKLKYVFDSAFFERVVLPTLSEEDDKKKEIDDFMECYKKNQTAELNFAKKLQHVADCVQIGGWRQFNYVRCPDIAWKIHHARDLLSFKEKTVSRVIEQFKNNKSCVLEMEDNCNPHVVVSALWHINTTYRNVIYPTPPMVSWSFIRAIEEELDERFWQVIWWLAGGPQNDFERFRLSHAPQIASDYIGNLLNCFSPNPTNLSHRTPDIIVIVNAKQLFKSFQEMPNPLVRPLAIKPILNRVEEKSLLLPIPNNMKQLLGNTRVVLLNHDIDHDSPELQLPKLNPQENNILILLSIFRFGFTQSMASLILSEYGFKGLYIRRLLKSFVERELLRYGQGQYHVPNFVKITVNQRADNSQIAKRHYAAGIALAPYCSKFEVPSLAFDTAYLPEHIHEAVYHFSQSFKSAQQISNFNLRNSANSALEKVQRFIDLQGWNTIGASIKRNRTTNDEYEFAKELLESQQSLGYVSHPVRILQVCQMKIILLANRDPKRDFGYIESDKEEIVKLFESALEACDKFQTEKVFNQLHVLSKYAFFLENFKAKSDRTIDDLNSKAIELLDNGASGKAVLGEWYEWMGDKLSNPTEAVKYYLLGVKWQPEWHQLWIKMAGTSSLSNNGHLSDDAKLIFNALTIDKIATILTKSLEAYRKFIERNDNLVIKQRWDEGFRIIKQHWPDNPNILRKLAQFSKFKY